MPEPFPIEPVEGEHAYIGFDLLMVNGVLIVLVMTSIWAEQRHIPASAVAIIVGAVVGGFMRVSGAGESSALQLTSTAMFDEEVFLYLLLPPIIFEAGFSLTKGYFFSNLGTILLFAVVGTLLSTIIIGQTCHWAGVSGLFASKGSNALDFRTPRDSYLFGALISATDPVATLSIMGAVNADPVVYTLVFGESVLNDAVAM